MPPELIIVLVIVLGLVTLVGHGLWVLIAALVRRIRPEPPSSPPPALPKPEQRESDEVVTRRVLQRLVNRGLLPDRVVREVKAALEREQRPAEPAPPLVQTPPPLPAAAKQAEPIATPPQPSQPQQPPPLPTAPAPLPAAPSSPPPPPPAPEPQHSWQELLARFLQSRNIRWGELAGGLLVIASSIALVLSFWNTITEVPWLKAGAILALNLALFAVARYAHRRWQLPRASESLAVVSLLLAPISLLAVRVLEAWPLWAIVGTLVGVVALLSWIIRGAWEILAMPRGTLVMVGLQLPALLLLVQAKLPAPDWPGVWWLPALLCALVGSVLIVPREGETALRRWMTDGFLWFGAALPLLFVTTRLWPTIEMPHIVAPVVALIGLPLVWAGGREWQEASASRRPIATLFILTGGVVIACAHLMALLHPGMLAVCSGLGLGLCAANLVRFRLPHLWSFVHLFAALLALEVTAICFGTKRIGSLFDWWNPDWFAWATWVALGWLGLVARGSTAGWGARTSGMAMAIWSGLLLVVGLPDWLWDSHPRPLAIALTGQQLGLLFVLWRLRIRWIAEVWALLVVAVLRAWGMEWSACFLVGGVVLLGLSLGKFDGELGAIQRIWRERALWIALPTPLLLLVQLAPAFEWTWQLALLTVLVAIKARVDHSPRLWMLAQGLVAGVLLAAATLWAEGIARIALVGIGWAIWSALLSLGRTRLPREGAWGELHRQAGERVATVLIHLSLAGWTVRFVLEAWPLWRESGGHLLGESAAWLGAWLLSLFPWFLFRRPSRDPWVVWPTAVLWLWKALFLAAVMAPAATWPSAASWTIAFLSLASVVIKAGKGAAWKDPRARSMTAAWLWIGLTVLQLVRLIVPGETSWFGWPARWDLATPFALIGLAWIANAMRQRRWEVVARASLCQVGFWLMFWFAQTPWSAAGWQGFGLSNAGTLAVWSLLWLAVRRWSPEWPGRFARAALLVGAGFWLALSLWVYVVPNGTVFVVEPSWLAWVTLGLLAVAGIGSLRRRAAGPLAVVAVCTVAHLVALESGWEVLRWLFCLIPPLMLWHGVRSGSNHGPEKLTAASLGLVLLLVRLLDGPGFVWWWGTLGLVMASAAWVEFGRTRRQAGAIGPAVLLTLFAVAWSWWNGWPWEEAGLFGWVGTLLALLAATHLAVEALARYRLGEAARAYPEWPRDLTLVLAIALAVVEWGALLLDQRMMTGLYWRCGAMVLIAGLWMWVRKKRDGGWALLALPALTALMPGPWALLAGSLVAALLVNLSRSSHFRFAGFLMALTTAFHALFLNPELAWWGRMLAALVLLGASWRSRAGIALALAAGLLAIWAPGELSIWSVAALLLAGFSFATPAREAVWQLALFLAIGAYAVVETGGAVLLGLPSDPALAALLTAGAWVWLAVRLIRDAAMESSRQPEALEVARKQVYGAEILLFLAVLHVRLTQPQWFETWLAPYWPFLFYVVALAGIGLAEWFTRRGNAIFPEPLRRSGYLLPLIPLLAAWTQNGFVGTANLLVGGILYSALALTRRSVWFTAAAALFLNAGYWRGLLETPAAHVWQHPQLWLVPLAISGLATIQLHRKAFPPAVRTPLRNLALALLYLSSTADLILNGLGQSAALALLLAVFSVIGMGVGLWLRTRAFLFTGAAFLVVSLLALIWSAIAQVGWHWIWALCGLALGLLIIAALAAIEKRREKLERWWADVQEWEA